MGRHCTEYLCDVRLYCCGGCRQHIAKGSALVSRQFHSKLGRAYLFDCAHNVVMTPPEERLMTTGVHIVRDISCSRCLKPLGWKYEGAHEQSQSYKVGKFILERVQVVSTSHTITSPNGTPDAGIVATVAVAGGIPGGRFGGRLADDSSDDEF